MTQRSDISGAATPRLEARHSPSGLNSQFHGSHLPFSDYVALTRDMLRQARSKFGTPELEKIVEGNAPFELKPAAGYAAGHSKPYRRGILLIHGLTDSPYFMRYMGTFFQENGFRVMAILLPGHGTQPGDLLDVTWHEWAKAVAYGTDQLALEADEIYLAGYSAGCSLSINQSLHDARVRGLFLFSPALRISPRAIWANWHKFYSWLKLSARWVNIRPDKDIYKYESFTKNAAAQMRALTRTVSTQLQQHKLDIPVFAATSQDDTTAFVAATLDFMAQARHPSSKLVLYTTGTNKIPLSFPQQKLEQVNSVVPEQNIISSSHTAVMLPPEDAHYGVNGEYSNCAHYYPGKIEQYTACSLNPPGMLQGEITLQNLEMGTLRRLMYNPNFAALKISLQRFIGEL